MKRKGKVPLFLSRQIYFAMYTVYILYSQKLDRYYVGYTNDLDRRLSEHNRIKGKYTDTGLPWIVVHTEEYQSKKHAQEREKAIKKKKSKQAIIEIINSWQSIPL